MKKMMYSFKNILKSYAVILLLYFSFFLANGGMENNIPFVFDAKGMSGTLYGVFWSILNVAEVVFPLVIVFLNQKFAPWGINLAFLGLAIISCGVIGFAGSNGLVFGALLVIYLVRIVFNFSVGNEINLAVPSEERSEYFAVRDIFLYGAVAVSTFFSGKIIERTRIEYVYVILGVGFAFAGICTFRVRHMVSRENQKEKSPTLREYLGQMKTILKNKIFLALLVIQIASVVYSVTLKFVPLLAMDKGISIAVFLKYTSVFTIVNCVGSLVLAYGVKGDNKKAVYIFDIAFDILSALFFVISENPLVFLAGYGISLLKDMFAPVSFGYMYHCIERLGEPEDAPIVLGLLTTISNVANICIPVVVGISWKQCFVPILFVNAGCLLLAVVVGICLLPVD
ncbi:MAG: MFS transporter [Roseburia sp.]|nr:MFS transporter [Roseburia sp.]